MLVLLNLEYIKIRSCTNIVYFLSMPSVSEALPLLTSLKMWGCKKLEQVFLLEEENLGGGRGIQIDKVRFPRLEKIQLYNLEALNGFCNGIHNIQLPSLHTLTISKLPNIRGFFPNDDSLSTEPNHSANTQSLFRKEVHNLPPVSDQLYYFYINFLLFPKHRLFFFYNLYFLVEVSAACCLLVSG